MMVRRLPTLVRLICSEPGCPRQKWMPRRRLDPKRAAVVQCYCDWHEYRMNGCKGDETRFFDVRGNEIDWTVER